MKKKYAVMIGIITGVIVVVGIIAKLGLMLDKFKKNSDFFFWMDREELDFDGDEFEDTCISAAMSSVTVDLSQASPSVNPMNLCLKGYRSSIDVIIPKGWNIKVQGDNRNSMIENATTFNKENFEAPLLFVNYRLNKSSMNIYYGYVQTRFEDLSAQEEPEQV